MTTPKLIRAILEGEDDQVRTMAESEPGALSERSSSGDLPLDLARKAGRIRSEVALTRCSAPGTPRPARDLLLDLVAHVSNDYFAAGWLCGLDKNLWRLVFGGSLEAGPLEQIPKDLAADLRYLAESADGWWGWLDSDAEPRFYSRPEWEAALARSR